MSTLMSNITKDGVFRTFLNLCSATVMVKTPSIFLYSNAISNVSIDACYLSPFQGEESDFISEDTKRVFHAK